MSEIHLPSLGAEMEEGTLLEWYIKPGDTIAYGQVIALLDTEKAEIEMEAFVSGTIENLLIEPGQTVPVGAPIATLVTAQADITIHDGVDASGTGRGVAPDARSDPESISRECSPGELSSLPSSREPAVATPARETRSEATRIKATPLARRLARERGLDLATLAGSGPQGAILAKDVSGDVARDLSSDVEGDIPRDVPRASLRDLETETRGAPARPESTGRDARAIRRREIIAAAMTRSKREIPHYYLSTSIEIDRANAWLAERNRDRVASERLVMAALLVKSVALAAKRFPELNGHWRDKAFQESGAVHIGMVTSLRTGGLAVPTLRHADEKPLPELMEELRDVVGRARAGRLRSGELGDATLSITSLGEGGAETVFGVIYPPQVAIVGFGGVRSSVRARGNVFESREILRASLAADHRASDGQRGSTFLQAISEHLQEPEHL